MRSYIRICYLIDHLGPGGAQEILLGLVERRSAGVHSKVYSLRDRTLAQSERRLANAQVEHCTLALRSFNPTPVARLRRWLIQDEPDLIHTFLDASNVIGPILAAAMAPPKPLLVRHINNDPFQHYHWTTRRGLRVTGRGVAGHIADSSDLAVALRRLLPGADVAVVPPGIDLDRFAPASRDVHQATTRRGARSATIGTVARLTHQKGIDTLIDAALQIRYRVPELSVLVAGEGPLRAPLEAQIARLGLARTVRLLGHVDDVRAVHRELDIFVLASRHEGWPLAVIEAMAMGVPVVATRVTGLAEAVRNGETGVLIEPDRPHELADAVVHLLADDERRRALADAARAWVRAERSAQAMTRRVESIYASIVSRRAR